MKKSWELSRRTFLRGAGTLMALPVLEAMMPSIARAQSAGTPSPRRLAAFFVPNGMYPWEWYPSTSGENYTFSPLLMPLGAFKSDILVLSGLGNKPSHSSSPVDVGHVASTSTFLTGTSVSESPLRNGISMDQVAAGQLKQYTRFPSLELGTQSGTSYVLHNNISWGANSTPRPKEIRPDILFDRLFEGMDPNQSQEAAARQRRRLSVLDYVKQDTARLEAKLGRQDQLRMEEYLTGVRELEQRVQQARPAQCAPGARPVQPTDVRQQVRLMLDMMVLAFQCDQTRVATFMYGSAVEDSAYNFLSVPDERGNLIPVSQGHHTLSHEITAGTVSQRMYSAICKWEVEQFAYLLGKMKAVQEPDGTLLDNSVVLFGSGIGESNLHDTLNMPLVLAGRGGGKIRPGRHLVYKDPMNFYTAGVPVTKLFVSMLNTVGVNVTRFGEDGDGPLPELA